MGLSLTVDLEKPIVTIRSGHDALEVTGDKWIQFYVRLAFGHTRGEFWISGGTVSELDAWKANKAHSIGKSVSRYISTHRLARACIHTVERTKRWRLHADTKLRIVQDASLNDWLRDHGMARPPSEISLPWLTNVVRAQIAFHAGDIQEAATFARSALDAATDDRCMRVSAILSVRAEGAAGRLDDRRSYAERALARRRAITRLSEEAIWGSDSLGLHCRARLAALEALRSHSKDAPNHARSLRRALQSAGSGADLSRLTVLHNTLGVLARREGRYAEARFHLAEATVLALTVNDLFTLGGAIFNLALTLLVEPETARTQEPLVLATSLLTMCEELDRKVKIGRSSAQAEILLARLHVGGGRLDKAEALIGVAERMVSRIGNPYDEGCLCLARAELAWVKVIRGEIAREHGHEDVERLLRAARGFFEQTETDAWQYVDDQLERLHQRGDLSIPWKSS